MNTVPPSPEVQAAVRKDLKPIVDLFTSNDGGVGLGRLQHGLLEDIYGKTDQTKDEKEFIHLIKQFSGLCQFLLKR